MAVQNLVKSPEVRLIGWSTAIRTLDRNIDRAAWSDANVLITGETGVGKDVVSRLIHSRGPRASSPLVTLNCAGLPDSLLESELFGPVRGSFTSAYRDKPGLLEIAPNGTVFLDEVGELSARMQLVLLRFLASGEIQHAGADRSHTRVDVRLIAATNRDLQAQVTSGEFREDLYSRLNVIRLSIPPLRARPDDIPLLVEYFLHSYGQVHQVPKLELLPEAAEALVAYGWPGNVRELKNVVERIVLKTVGRPVVRRQDLPVEITKTGRGEASVQELASLMLEQAVAEAANAHRTRLERGRTAAWASGSRRRLVAPDFDGGLPDGTTIH